MALLVHGVVAADAADTLDLEQLGVRRGEEVGIVTEGDLAALTSEVEVPDDEELMPTRELLLGHARLLEEAAAATTVLPMRFGVCTPSTEALRSDILTERRSHLLDGLDRLSGHAELRLRGRYDEATVLGEVLSSDPRARRLHRRTDVGSQIELGERVADGVEARRRGDAARASSALAPHAADVDVSGPKEPMEAFSVAFLVHDDQRRAFEEAVDALADELAPAVELELVGPMPPYSFVEERTAWAS